MAWTAALLPLAALPTIAGASELWLAWGSATVLLAVAMLFDAWRMPAAKALAVEVVAPNALPIGEPAAVICAIRAARPTRVELLLDVDGPHAPWPAASIDCVPGETARVRFELRAERRGVIAVLGWHLAWQGPLGLLRTEASGSLHLRTIVLPNVPGVRRKALQMIRQREFRSGARIDRYLGDGSEFEALREFVIGMDRRSVDWKATARHRKLLSREFRAERDHNVLLCIDAGRLMGESLGELPRLDHAIHAALQLGYVCLHTGDRVGLHTFADRPQSYMAPQSGMHALQAVQARLAEVRYGTQETNFTLGISDLLQRLRRRSLVVLFTEFVDTIAAELMLRNVQWLAKKHLLLFVAMRDPLLPELAGAAPARIDDVHRAVVAGEMERERQLVLERLRSLGAKVIDCGPEDLAVDLVNRYLEVKRRELV
jgi:uncharacterized protein (DUF58 family)